MAMIMEAFSSLLNPKTIQISRTSYLAFLEAHLLSAVVLDLGNVRNGWVHLMVSSSQEPVTFHLSKHPLLFVYVGNLRF